MAKNILLSGINLTLRYGTRAALIGPMGRVKPPCCVRSPALPVLGGDFRIGSGVRVGYMTQEQEELDAELNAFDTIRKLSPVSETEARTFLHRFLFSGDDVFVPVGSLSYGERARLSLACLVSQGVQLLVAGRADQPPGYPLPVALRAGAGLV
jgi:ATP-binding cassette, subfamily F, member 3